MQEKYTEGWLLGKEKMGEERWIAFPNYEGCYEVSTWGRTKTLERPKRIRGNGIQMIPERIRIPTLRKSDNRLTIALWKDNKFTQWYVHQMILTAFTGPCPEGLEGCHENGKPWHNWLSNLRWDTHRNNMNDREKHGTGYKGMNQGEKHGMSKLTESQVRTIKLRLQGGEHYRIVAKNYPVGPDTIRAIRDEKIWGWLIS